MKSMMDELGFGRYTPVEKDILAYLASKSIQNKDIWGTPVSPKEFFEKLKQYEETQVHIALMHLSDCGIIKRDSGYEYIPALGVRLICQEYLRRHPEIKDVNIT